jgi:hypothetical protein
MAARTFSPKHDEQTRLKIKTSQLINRLNALVAGEVEMPPHAVTAALGLLRKVLPDLSAQELTGDVTNYVARLPEPAKDVSAWQQSVSLPVSLPKPKPLN